MSFSFVEMNKKPTVVSAERVIIKSYVSKYDTIAQCIKLETEHNIVVRNFNQDLERLQQRLCEFSPYKLTYILR